MSYPEDFLQDIKKICSKVNCSSCPFVEFYVDKLSEEPPICSFLHRKPKEWNIVDIKARIMAWKTAHPSKTRQSEMLKIIPDTELEGGIIALCPSDVLGVKDCNNDYDSCYECRKAFWLKEI